MSIRSKFAAPTTIVLMSALGGCGGESAPAPANNAGAPTAGTSAGAGGSGGLAPTAGVSGGASGASGTTAGISGGGGAGGGGGAATAGASGTGDVPPATFETVKLVFGGGGPIMPCSAAPCHGVNGMAPPDRPLELPPTDDQQLYTNLTSYVSKACNNTKLVTPGKPAESALLTILTGPCGATPRMPYGCSADAEDCIPDEYIAAVRQWIMNGAPRQ